MGIGLEIPVFGAEAASRAVELGASRIELNAAGSYPDGGLTPSLEDLASVTHINAPVRIMIRPRGPPHEAHARDFIYSNEEFEQMDADIRRFKETGLLNDARGDGFVFGILKETPQLTNEVHGRTNRCWVDKDRCWRLVETARPFKTVFHRAFDEIVSCDDGISDLDERDAWSTALDDLVACGFDAILTSGGIGHAASNISMLDKIITRAESLGIEIIVGGGVRKHNVGELSQRLKLSQREQSTFVHSACLSNAKSEHIDADEVAGILSELG
ncbi:hypothetical protein F5Y13DRAFT_157316 [Hypoxylon sp. FL1857]|nr:hypothetical protein F5Y13DRAFT_157316 [Hypoxylon sp. FL1857]